MARKKAKERKEDQAVTAAPPEEVDNSSTSEEGEEGKAELDTSYVPKQRRHSYVVPGKRKRIFQSKRSILTELTTNDPNMEALYHSFMVMVLTAILYSVLKDFVEEGAVDLTYFLKGFGPLHQQLLSCLIWVPLQAAALLVYPAFKLWESLHARLGGVVDATCVCLVVLYNITAHSAMVYCIVHFDMPPVSAVFLSVEQLRFSMKSYSFIRENAYKVLYPWHKDDTSGPAVWYQGQMDPKVGSFSQYLYFLFAPTGLYRDHYPRTERVRKLRVLSHLAKTAISLAFIAILTKELFDDYPISGDVSRMDLTLTFLSCLLYGLVIQFFCGYFFLHCWSNLFGELLRFADREFYSDWWTCTSFSTFYRKWNLLVHDWIKAYIYQDFKDLFKSKFYNRIASLPTIVISALFHEYVLWAPLRFVMPVLLTQYGIFGALLFFFRVSPTSRFWNYFLHASVNFGVAVMLFCYATEFYARQRCPKEVNFVNTFIPRTFECLW